MQTDAELRSRVKAVEFAHSLVDSVAERYTAVVRIYSRSFGAFKTYEGILRARALLADLLVHIETDSADAFEARILRCHRIAQEVDHSVCLHAAAAVGQAAVVVKYKIPKTPMPWPFFQTKQFANQLGQATSDLGSHSRAVDGLRPDASTPTTPAQSIKMASERGETFAKLMALHESLSQQYERLENADYLSEARASALSWTLVACAAGLYFFVLVYFGYRATE